MNKKYEILQDFKGSPDGITVIQYSKGTDDVELSDALAEVALAEKWVKLSKAAEKEAKAKAKAKAEAEAKAKAEAESKESVRLKEEAITPLQTELDQLNADLTATADAGGDTAPLVAQIDTKQAELDALLA